VHGSRCVDESKKYIQIYKNKKDTWEDSSLGDVKSLQEHAKLILPMRSQAIKARFILVKIIIWRRFLGQKSSKFFKMTISTTTNRVLDSGRFSLFITSIHVSLRTSIYQSWWRKGYKISTTNPFLTWEHLFLFSSNYTLVMMTHGASLRHSNKNFLE